MSKSSSISQRFDAFQLLKELKDLNNEYGIYETPIDGLIEHEEEFFETHNPFEKIKDQSYETRKHNTKPHSKVDSSLMETIANIDLSSLFGINDTTASKSIQYKTYDNTIFSEFNPSSTMQASPSNTVTKNPYTQSFMDADEEFSQFTTAYSEIIH